VYWCDDPSAEEREFVASVSGADREVWRVCPKWLAADYGLHCKLDAKYSEESVKIGVSTTILTFIHQYLLFQVFCARQKGHPPLTNPALCQAW